MHVEESIVSFEIVATFEWLVFSLVNLIQNILSFLVN